MLLPANSATSHLTGHLPFPFSFAQATTFPWCLTGAMPATQFCAGEPSHRPRIAAPNWLCQDMAGEDHLPFLYFDPIGLFVSLADHKLVVCQRSTLLRKARTQNWGLVHVGAPAATHRGPPPAHICSTPSSSPPPLPTTLSCEIMTPGNVTNRLHCPWRRPQAELPLLAQGIQVLLQPWHRKVCGECG